MPNSSIRVGQTVHHGTEGIPWLQNCKYLFPLKEDSLRQSSSCEVMQNILIYLVQATLYFKCFLILCGVNTSIAFTLFYFWSFNAHLKSKYFLFLHQWSLVAALHNYNNPDMVSLTVNVETCSQLILQHNAQKCWCVLNKAH